MKVIFLQDVSNLAKAGDIKEVADGYGRNFLIPRNLALPAKSAAVNMAEVQRRIKEQRESTDTAKLAEMAGQLEGKEVTLQARAGAKDRLYGTITASDIASELEKSTGIVVDKRKIELGEPIRQLGSHEVTIRLTKDLIPKIKVIVTEKEAAD